MSMMTLDARHNIRRARGHPRLIRVVVALLMIALITAAWSPPLSVDPASAAGVLPAGLPSRVMLGVSSSPDRIDWMRDSGVLWDLRYQYLAGGVNTGGGWVTWNDDGDFALYYMQDSARHGYVPVLTYYQLLQSRPAAGGNEAEKLYSNLNNAATMRAYFDDFLLLMHKARAFGKPVIVHVEPDLFGFMHQRVAGGTNAASSIPAKVAGSGHPEAAGLPDTFQGFNLALLRMRDRHAPSVIMAAHVSHWSNGVDIGTDRSTNLNVAAIGQRTAAFHNSAGIAGNPGGIRGYDLIFFDPSDRDAAYTQHVWRDGGARWWDASNRTFPNFARYAQYVAAVTQGTGRRALLWQVPIGNTHFRTMNNTDGHYQDNRVEYFLGGYPGDGHLAQFANAGVIGILFGSGGAGATTYEDAKGDGITNPDPINGNTAESRYADDDGGYLRIMAGRYYQQGALAIGGSAPQPFTVKQRRYLPLVRR
jgi:hypothetical protein